MLLYHLKLNLQVVFIVRILRERVLSIMKKSSILFFTFFYVLCFLSSSFSGSVLCVEVDGRIQVEDHCNLDVGSPQKVQSEVSFTSPLILQEAKTHCGECLDFPIGGADQYRPPIKTLSPVLQFLILLPLLIVTLEKNCPKDRLPQSVSDSDDVPFFLHTIILRI